MPHLPRPLGWLVLGAAVLGAVASLLAGAFLVERLYERPIPRAIVDLLGVLIAAVALGTLVHLLIP